jgi:hypothetical protein
VADRTANVMFTALLAEAEWSPRQLAQAVNATFGAGTVSQTAGYAWRDHGTVPRRPMASRVAAVLTFRLGRQVSPSQIWPALPDSAGGRIELASQGLHGPWERSSAVRAVTDWLSSGDLHRRTYLAVTGTALMQAVWAWLDPHGSPPVGPRPPSGNGHALIEHVEASIPLLQRLDDAHGGAANLAYVEAQLRAVALVLREASHPEPVVRRLLAAAATLGQLCGWMALDAGEDGCAQRHWFTALRAAREVGDRPLAAHILADLAFQAANTGTHTRDGIVLGEGAAEIAARAPATVRASVSSRLAYAYAAAGRRSEFENAVHDARSHLDHRQDAREPEWMYFLTPSHLDCQAGNALIAMGRRQLGYGDRDGRRDLSEGISLLRTGAYGRPLSEPSQRRALHEGAWLALGHATLGDHGEALDLADLAVSRLRGVNSPRSALVLNNLVGHLRPRHQNPLVRERLPAIEYALKRASR